MNDTAEATLGGVLRILADSHAGELSCTSLL